MVSLRQIRYFIATAETGKISAAAKALRISQSAITLSIKNLEASLGVSLFERHANGVDLTREGHQFLYHARNIEGSVTDAVQSTRRDRLQIRGKLSVGVSYTVSGYFIFPFLARFRRAFPGIEVRLQEGDRKEIEQKLYRQELDCAVMLESNLSDRRALDFTELLRAERRLWLSSAHHLLSKARVNLEEVAVEPYVMLAQDVVEQTTLHFWAKVGLSPNIVFRTSSLEAVRSMVATGAAVSILSDIAYRPWSLEGSRVEARSIEFKIPPMIIGLVRARGCPRPEVYKHFREFMTETIN